MLSAFVLAALLPTAQAEDACDAKALAAQIVDEPPFAAAKLFVELAACSPPIAKRIAPAQLPLFISGPEGNGALVAAIDVGAVDAATAWLDQLQSDERAKAISALGRTCEESTAVRGFFIERSASMGEDFWNQRWYRALDDCHHDDIQSILWGELGNGPGQERSRWFAVLETAARGTGPKAVDKLKALLVASKDVEVQVNIVGAFADAAQIGSDEGINAKTAAAGVAALLEVAPSLSGKAVSQARITVGALGDAAAADGLAGVFYKDLAQDGRLLWGAVIVEDAQCKGGKQHWQRAWVAPAWDAGVTWPDQLGDKVKARAQAAYDLDLADKCKASESKVNYILSNEPFASAAELSTWAHKQADDAKADDVKKFVLLEGDDAPALEL
jgi:hypothetical protein